MTDSNINALNAEALLRLLQLTSPALPVGAYSYSEGLETLVQQGKIVNSHHLTHWIEQELRYGAVRLEAAIGARVYHSVKTSDLSQLGHWNQWLSAYRDSEELREQSWQMGRSLTRLLLELEPSMHSSINACGEPCNFAIAFHLAAAHWQIDCKSAVLGYLQSWATNLVGAGVKLIPLGQTAGQKVLLSLYPAIYRAAEAAITLPDTALDSCSWGLAIASMHHETLYSRLFRS